MAFPVVAGTNSNFNNSQSTSHSVSLPASIAAGNLLVVKAAVQNNSGGRVLDLPAGWTKFYNQENSDSRGATAAWWRVADGAEGATVTCTITGGTCRFAAQARRITGWSGTPVAAAAADAGASVSPNPPNLAFGFSDDHLVIAGYSSSHNQAATAIPSGYANQLNATGTSSEGATISTATREVTGTAENPAAFTQPSSLRWVGFTIAVRGVTPWTGSLASVSAMHAALWWQWPGSMHSVSAMHADLSKPWVGSGAFASVSSMSGHFTKTMPLIGSVAALSVLSGNFIRARRIASQDPPKLNVVSTMHADVLLTGLLQLEGNIPSLSAMSGHMVVDRPLTSILESVSAMSANLGVGLAGGVSGGLAVGRKIVKNLIVSAGQVSRAYVGSVLVWPIGYNRGQMASVSALGADLEVTRPLSGSLSAISAFAADLDTGFKNLSGTIASSFVLGGNLIGTVGLSGSFASGSAFGADFIRARKFSGAVDTISDSRADLASSPVKSFSGIMASTSGMNAALGWALNFQEVPALRIVQSGSSANITIPSGVQEGDILVWHNAGFKDGSDPTNPTPSGWTKALTVAGVAFWSRYSVFVRVAPAGYGSTVVAGIVGDINDSTLNVFRDIRHPATAVDIIEILQQITNANPSSQIKPVAGVPIIWMGFYSGALDTIVRTFTPAADGELETSDGGRGIWTKWKCYNISALGTTIDSNDVGSDNVLMSLGLQPEYTEPSFPFVRGTPTNTNLPSGTSHPVNLPSAIQPGEKLVMFLYTTDTTTVTTPAGWTLVGAATNSTRRFAVYEKDATGSEGATVTVTTSATLLSATVYRINADVDIELSAAVSGLGEHLDAPSLSPSWGADDTLWFTAFGISEEEVEGGSPAEPTNYSNGQWAGGLNECSVMSAQRSLNAASENPAMWDLDGVSRNYIGYTVAMRLP